MLHIGKSVRLPLTIAQAEKSRSRKACFSDAETRELIDLFSKKKDMLLSNLIRRTQTEPEKKKAEKGAGGNNRTVNSRAVAVLMSMGQSR